QGGAEADRALAEDGERVAAGHVEPPQRTVGGAGAARDRGALLEGQRVGQWHQREGGGLHVRRVTAVAGDPVHRDAAAAELRPAAAAMLAASAALAVMVPRAL